MMRILNSILFFCILFSPLYAEATRQVLTPMLYQGTNHFVTGFQLNREMLVRFGDKRYTLDFETSANWKGYWDELELRGNRLFVTYLDVYPKDFDQNPGSSRAGSKRERQSLSKEYFGVKIPTNGLFAVWFTGTITEPIGEPIFLMSNITEEVRIYHFKKGILVRAEERESDYIIEKRRKESANIRVDHISGSQ